MMVITFTEMIGFCFLGIIIIACIIAGVALGIRTLYDRKFKQNCMDCQYYYLKDVAGAGDCCWYSCKLHSEYNDRHSMNDDYHYRKCDSFKKEGK